MTTPGPKRALILDDQRCITMTLRATLEHHGYTTREANIHTEAIASAREFQPDVFITGFNNGCGTNGCETATEILQFLPHCRVLIYTGSYAAARNALEQSRPQGYEFEIRAKPMDIGDLLGVLKSFTGQ